MSKVPKSKAYLSSSSESSSSSSSSSDSDSDAPVRTNGSSQEASQKVSKLSVTEKSTSNDKASKTSSKKQTKSPLKEQKKRVAESDSSSDDEPPPSKKPPTKKKKAEVAKPKAESQPKPAAAPVPTDKTQYRVRLGSKGKKYVRYSFFKGTHYIDLRELYEKDGDLLPTKKGIMMRRGPASQLLKMFDKIDEKLEVVKAGKSTEELLPVIDSINAKVYKFKSMILIDVGSYYARGGEEKRGKGLSMTEEQYAGLKAEADNIRTVLDDCL